jgi:hypothetical protein
MSEFLRGNRRHADLRMGRRKLIRVVGILLISWGAAGCDLVARGYNLPRWGKQTYESVSTTEFTGVIIPQGRAQELVPNDWGVQAQGYWTPAREDILRLESNVSIYLRETARDKAPDLERKLRFYKRQYAGIMRDGRRLVFCNYFCDAVGIDWVSKPVIILDSGDCFFQVEWDVATKTFSNLHINGSS